MSQLLIETFELLLKSCNFPCPYSIFRGISIEEALKEFRALPKWEALVVYNYLKKNYTSYDKEPYSEVIAEMEKCLARS
ncbi:MAG: hypothetical protein QW321_01515 [Candidatus Aenigmatarchaeota archaeon]